MRQLFPTTVADLDHDAVVAAYGYPADRPWLATTNQSGADRLAWAWGRSEAVGD